MKSAAIKKYKFNYPLGPKKERPRNLKLTRAKEARDRILDLELRAELARECGCSPDDLDL